MISFLMFSLQGKELIGLKRVTIDVSAKLTEEDLHIFDFNDNRKLFDFIDSTPVIDISCIDITKPDAITAAENLRKLNKNMYITLIADLNVSPAKYIRPSIMAGSIMLRPLSKENMQRVLCESLGEYLRKFSAEDSECFIIDSREGKQLVPFEQITYFESREKKIFLNTPSREYSFYGTLESIESKIGDRFIRCHRSFIVAKARIIKIMLSKNMVILDDNSEIPLSRSYKKSLKELGSF